MRSENLENAAETLEKTVTVLKAKGVKIAEQAEVLGLSKQAFTSARNYDNPPRQLELSNILRDAYKEHFKGKEESASVKELEALKEKLKAEQEMTDRLTLQLVKVLEEKDERTMNIIEQRLEKFLPQVEAIIKKLYGRASKKLLTDEVNPNHAAA